jgi:chemotaxis protein MotB
VSKKKYVALEGELTNTKGELQKTTIAKEELEAKFAKIKERVTAYNSKINSLNETNTSLNKSLVGVNNEKLVLVDDNTVVMSKNVKAKMQETLDKMSAEELAGAKTLKDSLNLAISYNLRKKFDNQDMNDDIEVGIDKTVVMISVSDKMLFNSGSYRVKSNASGLLQKLADIINSEPSMDVIIEGHTDSQTVKKGAAVTDNWDLSVKRATAIVRELQNKYQVEPSRLIASGRSSYVPIADNTTKDGRARNRRTNIIILPNLNKFFALLAEDEPTIID